MTEFSFWRELKPLTLPLSSPLVPVLSKALSVFNSCDFKGHPKTRAFITHGGTHGIYEGICHGVPMVMIPLFGDQGDNVHRMATRGVGVILSIHDITAQTLFDALNTVINESRWEFCF